MARFRWSRLRKLARLCVFAVGLSIVAAPVSSAATPGPAPRAVIQHLYDVLLDTMQHATALGPKGRYDKLQPVVFGIFDVPFMARLTIGSMWASLPPEQKYRVVQAYGRYITAVYANRFDGYAGERLEVLGEGKVRHGLLVNSRIVKSDGEPVTLNYLVHDNLIGWQIRDVYETGTISELATQRSDFAQILRTGGVEALIASLNKKADDLLKS